MKHAFAAIAAAAVLVLGGGASAQADARPANTPAAKPSCDQTVAPGHFTCFAMKRTDVKEPMTLPAAATPLGYGPADLRSAYNLPDSDTTATIAVVDAYDDPTAESDLATYRSAYGLPPCTTGNGCFTKLNQDGKAGPLPAPDTTGWAGEISLDLDMVSAICPSCHITLLEADDASDNLFTAVKTAGDLGITYVSMSWGGPETGEDPSYDAQYFRPSGVVYAVASGDYAYAGGITYPSSSGRVVSVGGTSLTRADNPRGWSESAWKTNDSIGAASGCSSDVPKPSWQTAVPANVCGRRADTDVSAVADPATGVAVYQTYMGGGWEVAGGTSAAAPIIAGVYALAGTPRSDDQPASYPYSHTGGLNDVTTGDNGTCAPSPLCTAATGWDGPTGLGTPDGLAAFAPGNKVTVTGPGDQTGTAGTPARLQIQATDSSPTAVLSYAATGLPAGLTIDAHTGLISGTPTTGGIGTVTITVTDDAGYTGSTAFTWTVAGNGTSCSGQVLLNPDFESGALGWTASPGVINTDGTHAHGGSGYAWLDGYGTAHTATLAQQVSVPAGCAATLRYQLQVSSLEHSRGAHDTLTVTANGQALQTLSNADQGTGYVERSVDLSAYAGKTVTITWSGKENSTLATSFFVDDTALTLG